MLPFANAPVPANPAKNMTALTTRAPLTPMRFSICEPTTAPTQNVIIMMLKVSPTAPFSRPNAEHMGAANIEKA